MCGEINNYIHVCVCVCVCLCVCVCVFVLAGRLSGAESGKKRSKLVLPAPQISDSELEEVNETLCS